VATSISSTHGSRVRFPVNAFCLNDYVSAEQAYPLYSILKRDEAQQCMRLAHRLVTRSSSSIGNNHWQSWSLLNTPPSSSSSSLSFGGVVLPLGNTSGSTTNSNSNLCRMASHTSTSTSSNSNSNSSKKKKNASSTKSAMLHERADALLDVAQLDRTTSAIWDNLKISPYVLIH
jgi:hypothetical protein